MENSFKIYGYREPDTFWISVGVPQIYMGWGLWLTPRPIYFIAISFVLFLEFTLFYYFIYRNKVRRISGKVEFNETGVYYDDTRHFAWQEIKSLTFLGPSVLFVADSSKCYVHLGKKAVKSLETELSRAKISGVNKKKGSRPETLKAYFKLYKYALACLFVVPVSLIPSAPRETFLVIASGVGRNYAINILLDLGTDVNHEQKGISPLLAAVKQNQATTVKLLISQGADVNKLNSSGETALAVAKKNNNIEIQELLQNAGASN